MKPLSVTLFSLLATASAFAQSSPVAPEPEKLNFFEIIQQGGIMMVPLAILSVITAFLICLYFLIIRKGAVINNRFMNQAENLIVQGDHYNLSELCDRQSAAVAKILGRAVDFLQSTPTASLSDIREVAEAEGTRQAGMLSQRITYLSDVGAIAPMVGLLGTVIGMIKSFMEIANGNTDGVKQMQLANGVYEALITTAGGLIIGLIAVIFYSFFRGRVQSYINELEAASTHLMAVLSSVNATATIPPTQANRQAPDA